MDRDRSGNNALFDLTRELEKEEALDRLSSWLDSISSRFKGRPFDSILRGEWLGHALHPPLTDLPLGCWFGAGLLDVFGGRSGRRGARFLIGTGLLAALPTAAAGLAEWPSLPNRAARRVAAAHAGGNLLVILLYRNSWKARRRDHWLRGVGWAMAGAALSSATTYLGGHLAYTLGVGTGSREGNPQTS